ncbi:Tetratricopeptide repeat (TPR)-like superfamily protein [Euphorbia peplus]|nr:Tetratricopeptide repeat (TPR)-like superfamily protein [Euphorbia peplus]
MGVKVASTCLQWSQPIVNHSPSSSQTLASAVSSPSKRRRHRSDSGTLVCRYVHRLDRCSTLFGSSTKLRRSGSFEHPNSKFRVRIKRACSASLDAFSDEEFSKKIEELALRFKLSDDDDKDNQISEETFSDSFRDNHSPSISRIENFLDSSVSTWPENQLDPPDWSVQDDMIPASIERKANSIDIPFSLRIIKRKLQWKDGFREAGESAYCSVKKAFSSMVFIIRELHSYSLQMREILFTEDLQGIITRVQQEMHASFVWLFQQVFSHTPTLMVYVMILLANFTVHSMGCEVAIAAAASSTKYATTTIESVIDHHEHKFDASSLKSFSVNGKTASIGGNNGGGGKIKRISSGTDGGGGGDGNYFRTIIPDGGGASHLLGSRKEGEFVSGQEELSLWNSIVDEASEMQSSVSSIDHETKQRLISPIKVEIEADDYADHFRTELLYQTGLSKDPNNSLLLANYAQFLYLVAHDYDRAEEYFKRATKVEGPDAEAYSKYASFLWRARKDLWAAEETFLEAINADPSNSYYAANYAHFLWNTGGEDTCFPLNSNDDTQQF